MQFATVQELRELLEEVSDCERREVATEDYFERLVEALDSAADRIEELESDVAHMEELLSELE